MINFKPRLLKNEHDYNLAMQKLTELMELNPEIDSPESDELELISLLIENYETKIFKVKKPSAIDAIKFRMDQEGLTQKDMEKYIGSRSKVSEVLSGKRKLSMSMVSKLHYNLGISLDILVQKPEDIDTSSNIYFINIKKQIKLENSKTYEYDNNNSDTSQWYQSGRASQEKHIIFSEDNKFKGIH
ncbi:MULTISPECIES: helix-turn-helix domain-containing protein [unclassified Arsenophonus]|uniref:helix-turn-helix domain-containing protein n=1 Tax=unclassified Arsenophonus TaxID=2627083 RepID=UPI00285C1697|nr:helix-turn-helix domain-containing protein [Arsenophonus sp.]MDR5611285.1 helix-turn-helix domain-containing protein [Arsenophonus sp.]MDR5615356.1 helix-turn-helix domain-containing protein [Arsenophonus sp.]